MPLLQSSTIPKYLLIVASSGRMLAQAAKQAGYTFFVIDLYADCDTRLYAQACYTTPSLAVAQLNPIVEALLSQYPITHVVYGSGFESHPESLYYLSNRLTILGNQPDVFVKVQDKKVFFSVLDELHIPYPQVAFNPPQHNIGQWLIKPLHGQGGIGIRRYTDKKQIASVYWQRYKPGSAHSLLFLADGENAHILGFNSQWATQHNQEDFIFSGVINDCALSDRQKIRFSGWLKKLVQVFALCGLNSLDFIQAEGNYYVLEINPRPPASMQLYDNVFQQHIEACLGKLPNDNAVQNRYSAYQIVYADHDIIIPDDFIWPDWCMDLPSARTLISKGQPICSIIASQTESRQALQQLVIMSQMIVNKLEQGTHDYGI